jgi:OmcA/MtrC family decaheme c-type cytochrome
VDFGLAVPDPDTGDAIIPHPGGPKTDGTCTNCHAPQPAGLPGLSVEDAHQRGRLNPNTPTLEVEILAVEDTAPAETPTVTFRVRVDGVGRDIIASPLERLSLVMAGPTTDFAGERSYSPQTDDAGSATDQLVAVDAAAGEFAYTLPQTVAQAAAAFSTPVAAEGSFGFMMEARQTFAVPLPAGGTEDVRVAARNPVFFFPVTDAQAVPRRDVVDMDKCNGCHRDLYFHGDTRTVAEACVFCHTGNRDTLGRSPVPAMGTTAVMATARFGPMIHRIHGGAIADKPYVLFAPGGVPLDFTDIRFPGAAQVCLTCHVEGAYDLPLDPGLLPTTTRVKNDQGQSAGVADVVPATSSSCRGCHDSDAAAAHTEIMTTESGEESCAVCHAIGKSAGLDIVHARPEWDH